MSPRNSWLDAISRRSTEPSSTRGHERRRDTSPQFNIAIIKRIRSVQQEILLLQGKYPCKNNIKRIDFRASSGCWTLLADEVFDAGDPTGNVRPDARGGPTTTGERLTVLAAPLALSLLLTAHQRRYTGGRPDTGVLRVDVVAVEGSECRAGRPPSGRRLCGGAVGESPAPIEWRRDLPW
jgi:hypothetical protein